MKILVDMNLSPTWVQFLAGHGHDARHWSQIGPSTAPDSELILWAQEHRYVILTHDLDFGIALAVSGSEAPSIVQLRSDVLLPRLIGNRVATALRDLETDLNHGCLVTLTPQKTKSRILPIR